MTLERKQEIVDEIRERVKEKEADWIEGSPGGCIIYTHYAMEVLREARIPCCPQAGTMCWPRITEEQDDGVCHTHFSYVWEPGHHNSRLALAIGKLPELHCWVGIIDTQETVDLTTKDFPQACRDMINQDWPGPKPPDYLWQHDLPHWVVYEPHEEATLFAMAKIWKSFAPEYLVPMKNQLNRINEAANVNG